MCGGRRGGERSSVCATGLFTCGGDIQVCYKNNSEANVMRLIYTFLSRHCYRYPLSAFVGVSWCDPSFVLLTAYRARANEKSDLLVRHVMPTFLSINVFRCGDSAATLLQLPLADSMIFIIRFFA
jgi:hypothetical protein